ncbi:MAG: hypothetical protein ACR2NB_06130 [Solirubrobacteraceae bacterium]
MLLLVLAHAGHWATKILYLAPVAVLAAALAWSGHKDKRDGIAPEEEHEPTLDEVMDGKHRR